MQILKKTCSSEVEVAPVTGLQKSTELQKRVVQRRAGQMKAAEMDTIVTC